MTTFSPCCLPTAVGSLPHCNPQDGVDLLLQYLLEIPIWPQLPNCNYLESMYIQFSGGMPFVRLDTVKERLYMALSGDIYPELEKFYTHVLEDDLEYFAIQPDYAVGMDTFLDRVWRRRPETLQWLKGQITGPISFGLMITDERKRAVLYHEEVFDVVVKTLAMKARWQIRKLKRLWPQVIIFIDEPYLSSFGSAFINLSREQVLQYLGEIIDAVHQENALAGVHCCGNTDWSILMDTSVDIINFDAYEYFQGMTLYIEQLKAFFERGGTLAWGIVPTSEHVKREDTLSLYQNFLAKVGVLAKRGIQKKIILKQALLTPSCGMGTLQFDLTERVLKLLTEVSQQVRSNNVSPEKKETS